ncbi:MAG: AAA family ATPase [Peptostreptococcaceae bacterium]
MKPIKLELSGLNSYREKTEIDFEKLTQRGLFGIFGNTGSGKSTILDAMTIAMYGELPEKNKDYINFDTDKAFLSYEFEIGNENLKRRYKINRDLVKSEKGITNYKALLTEIYNNGSEKIISDKAEYVDSKIIEIMGLKAEDFTKAVVLPQGKFNEFLKLEGIERRDMLERMFGLKKYGSSLISKVEKRKEQEAKKLNQLNSSLKQYENINEGTYIKTLKDIERLKEFEKEKNKELEWLINLHQEHKEIYEKQSKLEKCSARLKELDLKKDEIKNKKVELEKSINANKINPHINIVQNLEKKINEETFKLEFIQKKQDVLNSELINTKMKYEEIYKIKNIDLPKLSETKIKLEGAKNLELNLLTLDKEIKNIKEINISLEEEKIKKEKIKLDLQSQKDIEIRTIKELEKECEKLKINSELRNKIFKAYKYEKEYNKLLEENNLKSSKLEKLSKELEELNLKSIYIKRDKDNNTKKLSGLVIEEENILRKCPCTYEDILNKTEQIIGLKNKLNISKEVEDKKSTLQKELNEISENKYRLEREIKEVKDNLEINQRNILELEKELDKLKYLNLAKELRYELKNNSPCPVCGSRTYEEIIANIHEDDRVGYVSKKLDKKIYEDTNLKLKLDNITSKYAMNSSLEILNEKEIKELKYKFGEMKYSEINNKLKDEDKKLEILKSSLKNWEIEKQNILKKLTKTKEEQYTLEKEDEKLNILVTNYKQYIQEIKVDLELLESKFKDTKEKYFNLKASVKISNLGLKVEEINENEILSEQLNDKYMMHLNKKECIEEELKKYENQLHEIELQLIRNNESFIEKRKLKEEKYNEVMSITKGESVTLLLENIEDNIKKIITQENVIKKKLEFDRDQYEKYSFEKSNIEGRLKIVKEEQKIQLDILGQLLIDNKFDNMYEVKKASIEPDYARVIHDEIMEYEEAERLLNQKIIELKDSLGGRRVKDGTFGEVKNNIYNLKVELNRVSKEIGSNENIFNNIQSLLSTALQVKEEYKISENKLRLLEELSNNLKENKFVEFIASEKLKQISYDASQKLKDMTKGKYSLDIDSNFRFVVKDNFNEGKIRNINTLSGGEMFLTSLALAISASSKIQLKGNHPLELLVIDEGFGYLDKETLDTVIEYLEHLYNENLSIGIISHIEELKNRVPVKLLVEGNDAGLSSNLRIEYS